MQEKFPQFPSILEAVFLILALFMLEYLIGLMFVDVWGMLDLAENEAGALITVLANACLFGMVMERKGFAYGKLFHENSATPQATLLLLIVPIIMIVPALLLVISSVMALVLSLAPMSPGQESLFEHMFGGNFATAVVVMLVAPVLEEMLFRGVILRSFLGQYSRRKAIVASAILFGLAHMNLYQFISALVLGLVLGWLYERSRSLIPCILLHGAYNCAVWLVAFSGDGQSAGMSVLVWLLIFGIGAVGWHLLRRLLAARPA